VRFKYYLEGPGWAYAELSDRGLLATITASYLSDALGDLLAALQEITAGQRDAQFSWAEEPGEYRWDLTRTDDTIDLMVRWFSKSTRRRARKSDGRIEFRIAVDLTELVSAIVHGVLAARDKYGEDGYRELWINYPFPSDQLTELRGWLATRYTDTARS
jgi:hypothetical protein